MGGHKPTPSSLHQAWKLLEVLPHGRPDLAILCAPHFPISQKLLPYLRKSWWIVCLDGNTASLGASFDKKDGGS